MPAPSSQSMNGAFPHRLCPRASFTDSPGLSFTQVYMFVQVTSPNAGCPSGAWLPSECHGGK